MSGRPFITPLTRKLLSVIQTQRLFNKAMMDLDIHMSTCTHCSALDQFSQLIEETWCDQARQQLEYLCKLNELLK